MLEQRCSQVKAPGRGKERSTQGTGKKEVGPSSSTSDQSTQQSPSRKGDQTGLVCTRVHPSGGAGGPTAQRQEA